MYGNRKVNEAEEKVGERRLYDKIGIRLMPMTIGGMWRIRLENTYI